MTHKQLSAASQQIGIALRGQRYILCTFLFRRVCKPDINKDGKLQWRDFELARDVSLRLFQWHIHSYN